jgi:hypothetical protein
LEDQITISMGGNRPTKPTGEAGGSSSLIERVAKTSQAAPAHRLAARLIPHKSNRKAE